MIKLRSALRREWRLKRLASLALLLAGLGLMYAFFARDNFLTVAGLVAAVLGLRYLYRYGRVYRVENEQLLRLLSDHPRQIVWVYSVVTERHPFGFRLMSGGVMYFKLADGDDVSVAMSPGDLRLVSRFLNRVLPHAVFGYTPERERMFRDDPGLLIRPEAADE